MSETERAFARLSEQLAVTALLFLHTNARLDELEARLDQIEKARREGLKAPE